MASSSSSSSSSLWTFTVFLSFRGADTRRTFVSFLYKELVRKGIKTFKDDKELESGSSISPELLQAIEESKFAIVVVSENYASSGWCLEELTKIMECHEKGTLTAIPVFYEVEPSDVRRQSGKFGQHMKKHEGRENPEKVQSWRDALTKLANLSGECSNDGKDDSELVDKIVSDILNRFISTTPSDFSGLVGMDVRMKAMHRLLDLESNNEVRVIGIWGMGGIGKTTLARYVYEEISRHFQNHCFLENVKKIYQDGGSSRLQGELLSKTQGRALMVRHFYSGRNVIKSMLGHRRFLLVVDDVDKIGQLDALAKERSWFGPGSRVIVTTRDKHLLDAYGVKHVYKVECLQFYEALQLFRQSAFRDRHSLIGFEQLSNRAVELAGGLPLAIALFGSFLSSQPKEDWDVALDRLKRSPDKDIMEILQISYDGLDERDKYIFLRIACFFNGKCVDDVTRLVDNDARYASWGIKTLVDSSLIVVSSERRIIMHDLVQKMGRELAGQRSLGLILSESDEIRDALTDESGNKAIEGISLDTAEVDEEDEVIINPKALENMPNLKFFEIYRSSFNRRTNVIVTSDHNSFNRRTNVLPIQFRAKLRYLSWDSYPSKTIRFRAEGLVQLDLRNSKLEKLWEGAPCLGNLRKFDISWSANLKEFPNLSNAPNLELIDASKCIRLTGIPSSICGLSKLTKFYLRGCRNLEYLPNNMDTESLQIWGVDGCSSLKVFPQLSRYILSAPLSARRQISILKVFPQFSRYIIFIPLSARRKIFVGLSGRRHKELSESIGYLSHLEALYLVDVQFENLPDTIGNLTALEFLSLNGCHRLQRIPETVGNLISLRTLELRKCPRLQRIPETILKLKSLIVFEVRDGRSITKFPQVPENVKKLIFAETTIEEIPSWIGDLYSLQDLHILENGKLKCLPTGIYNLKALRKIRLCGSSNLQTFSAQIYENTNCFGELDLEEISIRMPFLSIFANLTLLEISRGKKCDCMSFCCPPLSSFPLLEVLRLTNLNMLELPDDLAFLTRLQVLDLRGNDFEKIPASIGQLDRLETLCINRCENLRSLPELPSSTIKLSAQGCVALETTKNMLKYCLPFILLNNCFKLKGDQHVTSRQSYWEFACLPGGEVPSSFNYQNTGHSLKVSLSGERNYGLYSGFAACILVAFDFSGFKAIRIEWTCKYLRGNSNEIVLDYEFDPWAIEVQLPEDVAFQSDHLFLFQGDPDWQYDIVAFDKVKFEFRFAICEDYTEIGENIFSQLEVKECGVSLDFGDDLKVHSERTSPHCSSSSNPIDQQVEIKLDALEPASEITGELNNAISFPLPLTCGDSSRAPEKPSQGENEANRKQSHGSIENKSIMDSEEKAKESSPKKLKFITFFEY